MMFSFLRAALSRLMSQAGTTHHNAVDDKCYRPHCCQDRLIATAALTSTFATDGASAGLGLGLGLGLG